MFKNILVLLNFYKPHIQVYDCHVDHNLQFRKMTAKYADFTIIKFVRH